MWKLAIGTITIGSVIYGLMQYFGGRKCRCMTRLDGLVIVITGANSGIGKALAFELANRGAILILACRNVESGISVKEEIYQQVFNNKPYIYVKQLDLNSFESIIKFAESVNTEFKEIYGLVNNAGVFYHPHQITGDGYDITYQTNYLGPFILTHFLMKSLKRSDHGRIVNVVSDAHKLVNAYQLHAITKNQVEKRSNFAAYGASKLALVLFTREFSKKIASTNVIINAVDPGNVETPIFRHFPSLNNPWLFALQYPIRLIVVKRPGQGCQTALHALLTSNHSSGQYLVDCRPVLPSAVALNDRVSREFYDLTMQNLYGVFSTESDC